MSYEQLLAKLERAWDLQDHPHATPATEEQLQAFETRHGVRLPSDLRFYFGTLNGGDLGHDGSMDAEMISFWRLDQVQTQEELNDGKSGRKDLFGFADWSIDCQTYEIELHSDPDTPTPVFIDFGLELQRVADSFSAFIDGYLRSDERVLYGIAQKPSA
jgi:hypothetical protein